MLKMYEKMRPVNFFERFENFYILLIINILSFA